MKSEAEIRDRIDWLKRRHEQMYNTGMPFLQSVGERLLFEIDSLEWVLQDTKSEMEV